MEKKDEKTVVLEKKSTKKWKILINNEINYYETDDEKIKDIDVVELFMNKTVKNK
jgi:molybdopterin converting factor small subunit